MGIRKGMINGVALGSVWLIIFVTYGFGFWYGAKKIREDPEDYTIGKVTLVRTLHFCCLVTLNLFPQIDTFENIVAKGEIAHDLPHCFQLDS